MELLSCKLHHTSNKTQQNFTFFRLLSACDLDANAAVLLARSISAAGNLESLDLSQNRCGDAGTVALCRALKGNTKLRKLNLRQNDIGIRGGRELGEMLSSPNLCLQKLNISWNCIKGQGAAALCRGLAENKFLQRLDASWNYFREDSALELGNSLARNKSLLHVNLEHCGVNDVAAVSLSAVETFAGVCLISPLQRY